MGAKRSITRRCLVASTGAIVCALLTQIWAAEPVAACGVRCGGSHPTAKPAISRPFQKPPQAAVVSKPPLTTTSRLAPTRAPAPPSTATRAPTPRAATAAATPTPLPPTPTATRVPASPSPVTMPAPEIVPIETVVPLASFSTQVDYVVEYYSLNDSRSTPKEMQEVLLANGFRLAKRPEPGAVVLFQPGYFKNTNGYDQMKDGGMIGIVSAIDVETPTTYRLIVHTAFDAPPVEAVPAPMEDDFSRIYDLPMGPYGKGQVAVSYFVR